MIDNNGYFQWSEIRVTLSNSKKEKIKIKGNLYKTKCS